MFEHPGNGVISAKVWMEPNEFYAEKELVKQVDNACRHPAAFSHVAIMPDGHGGYGLPIGGVAALKGYICPFGVGMDIGCGMHAVRFNIPATRIASREMRRDIKEAIKAAVPMGFAHHPDPKHVRGRGFYATVQEEVPSEVSFIASHDEVLCQLGTLGGGNHFIELQTDEHGDLWLMIHSGSRNLGARVCKHYHKLAVEYCQEQGIAIPCQELAVLPMLTVGEIPYWNAMNYCLRFAHENRRMMSNMVWNVLRRFMPDILPEDTIDVHHNYASLETHKGESVVVHRKGATMAVPEFRGAIPGSMGTASYIVKGKGCEDSFGSCSHGSGRRMSRGQAKKSITMTQFKEAMGDVVFDCDESLLDESPGAYKDIESVMANQLDLVDIVHELKPLVAMKAVKCSEE